MAITVILTLERVSKIYNKKFEAYQQPLESVLYIWQLEI